MSSYSDWKHGFISDAEYNRECRMEEDMARDEEKKMVQREILQAELRIAIESRIPDGVYLSDIYWEDDRLIVEFEEEEEEE